MTLTTKLSSAMGENLGRGFSKLRSEIGYRAELMKYFGKLPELSQADRKLCETLKRTGIVMTSLEDLGIPSTSQLMAATEKMIPLLQRTNVAGNLSSNMRSAASHCLYGDPVAIAQKFPAIHLWGLQDRILDILENYYGAPMSCIGVNFTMAELRKETATPFSMPMRIVSLGDRRFAKGLAGEKGCRI